MALLPKSLKSSFIHSFLRWKGVLNEKGLVTKKGEKESPNRKTVHFVYNPSKISIYEWYTVKIWWSVWNTGVLASIPTSNHLFPATAGGHQITYEARQPTSLSPIQGKGRVLKYLSFNMVFTVELTNARFPGAIGFKSKYWPSIIEQEYLKLNQNIDIRILSMNLLFGF